MKRLRSRLLATAFAAAASLSAPKALAFGIGLEASATSTSSGHGLWGPTGGILAENVFSFGLGFLDPWVDVQAPLQIDTNGAAPGRYLTVDLGLRLGFADGIPQPYFGVLGQMNILLNTAEEESGHDGVLWGLGGDLGVDFVLSIVRLGLEVRLLGLPSIYSGDTVGVGLEFQALASARLSF